MEGKGMVRDKILRGFLKVGIILCTTFFPCGCTEPDYNAMPIETVSVLFDTQSLQCRSVDPEENKISDINLFVFDEYGRLEKTVRIDSGDTRRCDLALTTGKRYRFAACVNFGYMVDIARSRQLQDLKFHLAYPDEYRNGIPMYSDTGYIMVHKGLQIHLKLIRLMSKISIRLDRSRLSEGVEMSIAGMRIGNCPRSVSVFSESCAESSDDCFPLGFSKDGEQCSALNRMESGGLSYPVSVYMLENAHGSSEAMHSYIELDIDYISPDLVSMDGHLKYRFYIGESGKGPGVERNCHYKITVCPENDGLNDDGWMVDKDALTTVRPPTFSYFPDSYIRGDIGDRIHIGCRFTPEDAPFDVGREYMENDRKEGIYDYEIDDDGHGAVLTLTGPGSGLIYMSAGPPVNESALWFIEVNQPTYLER